MEKFFIFKTIWSVWYVAHHHHILGAIDLDRGLKLSDEDLEDLELGTNLICSSLSSALTFEMDQRIEIRDKEACGMQEVCSQFIRLLFGQFGQVETHLLHIKIYRASFCCKIYGVDYFVTQTNSDIVILTDTLNNLQILKYFLKDDLNSSEYLPSVLKSSLLELIEATRLTTKLRNEIIKHGIELRKILNEFRVEIRLTWIQPNQLGILLNIVFLVLRLCYLMIVMAVPIPYIPFILLNKLMIRFAR